MTIGHSTTLHSELKPTHTEWSMTENGTEETEVRKKPPIYILRRNGLPEGSVG